MGANGDESDRCSEERDRTGLKQDEWERSIRDRSIYLGDGGEVERSNPGRPRQSIVHRHVFFDGLNHSLEKIGRSVKFLQCGRLERTARFEDEDRRGETHRIHVVGRGERSQSFQLFR